MATTTQSPVQEEAHAEGYRCPQPNSEQPSSRDESLGAFFEDLQIGNFTTGGCVGAYGMDWGHITLAELDKTAISDCLYPESAKGFRLERTPYAPEQYNAPGAKEASDPEKGFGKIEQPLFVAADGTQYTFRFVQLREGRFHVMTMVQRNYEEPFEEEYTIDVLRLMIGPMPPKIEPKVGPVRRLFKSLATLFA